MLAVLNEVDPVVEVKNGETTVLHVNKDSRDAIIAANTLLGVLADQMTESDTKLDIWRVQRHLSNMCYGFKEKKVNHA